MLCWPASCCSEAGSRREKDKKTLSERGKQTVIQTCCEAVCSVRLRHFGRSKEERRKYTKRRRQALYRPGTLCFRLLLMSRLLTYLGQAILESSAPDECKYPCKQHCRCEAGLPNVQKELKQFPCAGPLIFWDIRCNKLMIRWMEYSGSFFLLIFLSIYDNNF